MGKKKQKLAKKVDKFEKKIASKQAKKGRSKPKIIYVDPASVESVSLAYRLTCEEDKATTSVIQRRLKIGYAQAARLLDILIEQNLADGKGKPIKKLVNFVPIPKAPEPIPLETKRPVGRPSDFTPELGKLICERISNGESVRQICRDDDMPSPPTFYSWLLDTDKEDLFKAYQKAQEIRADLIHDEIYEIADDGTNDWMDREMSNGDSIRVLDHEHVQRSKLRIDARKWSLSHMNPKKYKDKIDLSSGGKPIKEARQVVMNYFNPGKEPAAKTK